MAISGPSRRRHGIQRVEIMPWGGSRAPSVIWEPISGHVAQKCQRFSKMLDLKIFNSVISPSQNIPAKNPNNDNLHREVLPGGLIWKCFL